MKKLAILALFTVLTAGLALAETGNRFEISAESGLASFLSGPEVKQFNNSEFRFGFYPSKEFEVTLTSIQWEGELGRRDSLAVDFSKDFNKGIRPPVEGGEHDCSPRPPCYQIGFKNAKLGSGKNQRNIRLRQLELGVVKTIPLGVKHWEAFVGVGLGTQRSRAQFEWVGYEPTINNPNLVPKVKKIEKDEFLVAVRGGTRYMPLPWLGLQLNFRWIPIAKIFGRDYNGLELNGGLIFRFGKF